MEGNRVLIEEEKEMRKQANPEMGRRESVKEANRQQALENRDVLREKWGEPSAAPG